MKVERTDDIVGDVFRRLLSVLPDDNSPLDVSMKVAAGRSRRHTW
jgi:hypothetical protein